jgi:hypothetical protein
LGYDVTLTSDAFGMVFFPNDSTPLNAVIYEATVSASGFSNKIENITINKLTEKIINLGT